MACYYKRAHAKAWRGLALGWLSLAARGSGTRQIEFRRWADLSDVSGGTDSVRRSQGRGAKWIRSCCKPWSSTEAVQFGTLGTLAFAACIDYLICRPRADANCENAKMRFVSDLHHPTVEKGRMSPSTTSPLLPPQIPPSPVLGQGRNGLEAQPKHFGCVPYSKHGGAQGLSFPNHASGCSLFLS